VITTLTAGERTADVAGPGSTVLGTRALAARIAANLSRGEPASESE